MSKTSAERGKDYRARMRDEGRCTVCGKAIGEPPQAWACTTCAEKAADRCRARHIKHGAPLDRPTFELFEAREDRRGQL